MAEALERRGGVLHERSCDYFMCQGECADHLTRIRFSDSKRVPLSEATTPSLDADQLAEAFRRSGFSVAYDSDAIPEIADVIAREYDKLIAARLANPDTGS